MLMSDYGGKRLRGDTRTESFQFLRVTIPLRVRSTLLSLRPPQALPQNS
jgi:hypothetical protein